MAHNLNFNEPSLQHSFFSVREKPWHGLGQIVTDYPTSVEAIKLAHLDFTVEKKKLFAENTDPRNSLLEIPAYFGTVRTDTQQVLGIVGKDYEIVQNTEAFQFFDSIVKGDGIFYETAGALGNGERIFITAKLPGYIKVGSDDLIEKYLFLTTSHDGFGSITAAFTPVRIVCNNTLNAALKNCSNSVKIRHTHNAKERLEEAHKVMGISNRLATELEEIFNHWTKVPVTDTHLKKLVQQAMAPSKEVLQNMQQGKIENCSSCFKNICQNINEYNFTSDSQQSLTTKGTLFGAYNAITGYFQNVRNFKNEEAKLKSIMYGNGLQRTQKAFDLCRDFARQGETIFTMN